MNTEQTEAALQETRKHIEIQRATAKWLKIVVVCNAVTILGNMAPLIIWLLKR
jgi:hypothetical protein